MSASPRLLLHFSSSPLPAFLRISRVIPFALLATCQHQGEPSKIRRSQRRQLGGEVG
jgi:hypothetical protein